MDSDDDLLAAWRAGDEPSGKALLSRHLESLYRFFATKVARDVDDLIQETLVGVVEGLPKFRDEAAFRTYLFAIARRRLLRRFRWHQRHGIRFDPLQTSVAQLATSPSANAAKQEARDQVLEAMRALPLDLQITLELHYWEQMTTAEIAAVLETPPGTVRGRLQRARAALEKALAQTQGSDLAGDDDDGDDVGRLIVARGDSISQPPRGA